MASLEIEVGGRTYRADLPEGTLRVGRDETADLRIDDPAVAPTQCTLEPLSDGSHLLVDANSGRPTKVNGAVAKRVALRPGDVVELGAVRLVYEPHRAPRRPRPAPVAPSVPVAPSIPVAPPPRRETRDSYGAPRDVDLPSLVGDARSGTSDTADAPGSRVAAPEASRTPRRAPTRSLSGPLIGVGAAAAIAIVAALLLGGSGSERTATRAIDRKVEDAAQARRDGDLREAEALYAEAARGPDGLPSVEAARRQLDAVRREIESADRAYESLWEERATLDADAARQRFEDLRVRFGEKESARRSDLMTRLATARAEALEARRGPVALRATALLDQEDFAGAWKAWDAFGREVAGADARRAAEDGRSAVAAKARAAADERLSRASSIAARSGAAAAATFLREQASRFAGLPAERLLEDRAAAYDRESRTTVSSSGPAPTPTAPTPLAQETRSKVAALTATADAKAAAREFAAAAAALDQAIALLGADPAAAEARGRRDDVRLAVQGVETLVRSIRQQPADFAALDLNSDFRADLVDADLDHVVAAASGGRTTLRWTGLSPSAIAAIAARARPGAQGHLEIAALLHAIGKKEEAQRALVAHLKAGGDAAALAPIVARWRGEPVPAGGYVVHEGAIVTPVERDRRVLESRIAKAAARVGAREAKVREAAYAELTALGEPAKAAFSKALRMRRDDAAREVASARPFTTGKPRARLVEELERRRAAALALIEDSNAYPYPSPSHQGQDEVDRLVGLVREIWERPFDVIAAWEPEIASVLGLVAEVDGVLARLEPGYAPDLEAVKGPINRAIDVPGLVPDEYSKKVLAFNERLTTTATAQEKENVRIVNEYRMMMGRPAVKLNERLLRAARGHSIHMEAHGYFAHEAPDPALRNPGDRARRQGYAGGVGENIAMGTRTALEAFDGWFRSSGHHRNMLGRGWTEMACGRSHVHWTQLFGAATGKSLDEPEALPPPTPDVAPVPDEDPAPPGDAPPMDGE